MNSNKLVVLVGIGMFLLSACMAKNLELNEQQERMRRCDQYIDQQHEACLRGEPVTIKDFNDDYKDYIKSRKEEENEGTVVIKPLKKAPEPPEVIDEPKTEDK